MHSLAVKATVQRKGSKMAPASEARGPSDAPSTARDKAIPDDSMRQDARGQKAGETVDCEGAETGTDGKAADEAITGGRLNGQVSKMKKGKGEGKEKVQESGDENASDDDGNEKPSANDGVDAYCWSKVVSDGQVDLPVPFEFGQWCSRPLNQKKDNELAQLMLTDVMTSATAKPLQLSDMGQNMSALRVAGGRHRYEPLKLCKVTAKKEITKYEEVLKVFAQSTELSDEDIAQRRQARKEIVDCGWKQATEADVNSKLHVCMRSTSTTYLVQADRDPAANLSRQSTDATPEDDDMPALMQVTEDTDDEDLVDHGDIGTGNVHF
jgi:hypothetical protein